MADHAKRTHGLKNIVEESRLWDAEYLLKNLDAELDRLERGIGHMIWDVDDRPVSKFLRPLPVTPKFSVSDSDGEFTVKVLLPDVPEEHMRVNVDKESVEVLACSDDLVCKPYYIKVGSKWALDPETARLKLEGSTLHIKVKRAKKKTLKVKKPKGR